MPFETQPDVTSIERLTTGVGCHRSHQPPLTFARSLYRGRSLVDAVAPRERNLDLAQLHSVATDLHLIVDSTQELEPPVAAKAHEVVGAVNACTCGVDEGIGAEALRRHVRPVQVAASETEPTDEKLAGSADRGKTPGSIDDVEAGVGLRPTRGNHGAWLAVVTHGVLGAGHDRLGRPELVGHDAAEALAGATGVSVVKRFATRENETQPGFRELAGTGRVEHRGQQRRHEAQRARDLLAGDDLDDAPRILGLDLVQQHQARSAAQ